jgi:DNA-binding transcriptional LysR family regulator
MVSDSRVVALAVDAMLARARGLTQGLEAEVSLVVDVMLPTKLLVRALEEFRHAFPTVALRLRVEALGAVTEAVLKDGVAFGVSGPLDMESDLLTRGPAGAVTLVPVAAPSHPLARLKGKLTAAMARDHIQLVLTDRSSLTQDRDFGVVAVKSWRLADLGAKHALLLAGLGWGSMPEPMVREDIRQGRLARLPIAAWDAVQYRFHTLHRSDRPPGPAAAWLMQRLAQQA